MAELILSAVLPIVFEKFAELVSNKFADRSKEVHSELKKWNLSLRQIRNLLNDAAQKEITDESVKDWLNRLQHLAYDLDDELDALATDDAMHSDDQEPPRNITSKRWNTLKKSQRYPVMNTGSQLSKAQLAARRALNIALDKPGVTTPKVPSPLGRTNPGRILVQPPVADPPFSTTFSQSYDSAPTGLKRVFPRPQPFLTKPLASGPDAVKAAAVAAGARIATPTDAAAIMKQQMKSTIHIKTTRSPSTPGVHMASDYFRAPYSRLSPNAPRSNTGSTLSKSNVEPVIQLNQFNTGQNMNLSSEIKADHVVTISSSVRSPDPIQNDKVVVSGNHEAAFSNQDARLGSMDLDQQAQPPGSSNPPNANFKYNNITLTL